MLTKQQIEIASRKLCQLRGDDPDEMIRSVSRDGKVKLEHRKWHHVSATIIEHDRILEAIRHAKEST